MKRTSGIDDLISTLVKQHGLSDAIDRAWAMVNALPENASRRLMWRVVHNRLKDMR